MTTKKGIMLFSTPSDAPASHILEIFRGAGNTALQLHLALEELGVPCREQVAFCKAFGQRELDEFDAGLVHSGASARAEVLRPILARHGITPPLPQGALALR